MIAEAWISIAICILALVLTLLLVRRSPATLALPLAYLINLLLIHVPGAFAFAISGGEYAGLAHYGNSIATGIMLTAIAALCFVFGVSISTVNSGKYMSMPGEGLPVVSSKFILFCLVCGWFLAFGVGPLRAVPTVGAAIYFGSSIWMLAALIGLSSAIKNQNMLSFMIWLVVLLVYPLTILVFSGFLSYGASAVIIVGALAVMQTRSNFRSLLVIVALGYLGISVFVNYFGSRTELRSTLWSTPTFEERVTAVTDAFRGFELFTPGNPAHLKALTLRLNQNEFVGIAADRLHNGQVGYLNGRSFVEALLAPIPRAIWKGKASGGGSGSVVREMTGLKLGVKTSWGIGNVMEFYINFGMLSLVPGFILLGFAIGWLDTRAASFLASPDPSRSLLYFLPCVALIQPNNSLVEIVGGAFASLLAAVGLRFVWTQMAQSPDRQGLPVSAFPHR